MNRIPERIGKYRIIKEIGRGATAVVYLAETPDYPEPVALKHVRFDDKARDEAKWNRRLIKLLKAERVVSGRLDHPNIIRIHDASIEPEQAYVVMEYFPGGSLERYCGFQNLLPIHRTIGIVFKCCMALDHAYRQGIGDVARARRVLVEQVDDASAPDRHGVVGEHGVVRIDGDDPVGVDQQVDGFAQGGLLAGRLRDGPHSSTHGPGRTIPRGRGRGGARRRRIVQQSRRCLPPARAPEPRKTA